ncbi:histidine kinase [Ekhidna sp.]|uniref:sensor histidine kinase n=1 Tax=Ekhidna sp. TaxID=2608089 RepID=UPI003296D1B7
MKKYLFRLSISFLIFLFFRLTDAGEHTILEWSLLNLISLTYTISVVLICWEVAAWSISFFYKKSGIRSNSDLYKITIKAVLIVLPFVLLFSYINHYYIEPLCYPDYVPTLQKFQIVSAQGFVLSQIIILYEIFKLYISYAVRTAREKEQIQKELVAAKYEGLKNQVNPHFLFNSFSVLSSLVEKDSKIAIEFIAKLSDIYRYILENDEKSVVSLQEELDFLDNYVFLLQMRHQSAIVVEKDISLDKLNLSVPPMSIQILVENAVKHNAFSIDDPLHISIKNEGNKAIVVENEIRKKENLSSSTKIGLKNLSSRLLLSVGKALEITDNEETFKVRLPLSLT